MNIIKMWTPKGEWRMQGAMLHLNPIICGDHKAFFYALTISYCSACLRRSSIELPKLQVGIFICSNSFLSFHLKNCE